MLSTFHLPKCARSLYSNFSRLTVSGTSPNTPPTKIARTLFDPHAKALQKARAALSPHAARYDYLRDHMANVLIDRLHDIPKLFPCVLDLCCGSAHLFRALNQHQHDKINRLRHADIHPAVLERAFQHFDERIAKRVDAFVFDERVILPVQPASFDAVLSAGGLHWVSDLPNLLLQIRASLRPDGVFLGAMLGGDSLHELRISMQLAEDQLHGRIAPRISPMVHLRDVASLLSSAGFTLPTADADKIVITYENMHALLTHLRGMGETNALTARHIHYGRHTFERAAQIYEQRFGMKEHSQSTTRIPATFEVMYMIGWAPSHSQPRALRRGSASVSLTDLTSTTEPTTG